MAKGKQASSQEATVQKSRDKSAKFIELATKRANKALTAIESIAALSNRNSYTYSDEQVKKIFDALETTTANAKKTFEGKGAAGGFTL